MNVTVLLTKPGTVSLVEMRFRSHKLRVVTTRRIPRNASLRQSILLSVDLCNLLSHEKMAVFIDCV